MHVHRRTIEVDSIDEPITLHATGDWHELAHGCARSTLRANLSKAAEDESALFLLMGDLADLIDTTDKRFDPAAFGADLSIADLADLGRAAIETVKTTAEPLEGRIIGAVGGNHEGAYSKRNHVNIHRAICEAIGCQAWGYSALAHLTFRERGNVHTTTLDLLAHHGAGAACTPGGKLNRLIRTMDIAPHADLVLMGHVHEQLSYRRAGIRHTDEGIGESTQNGVITGTYLRSYTEATSAYGERAGYGPTSLGHPMISIVPRSKEVTVKWMRGAV